MENCNVFQGDIYGATFPLPGAQVTINQFYGKNAKPKEEVTSGVVESFDEREKRKSETIKDIVDRFDFDERLLGYDRTGKRISCDRIKLLFQKCFGIGCHPTSKSKEIMEQMWVLLIDERNQCNKEPDEGFFRQTVLNVLGHYRHSEVICGGKNDLLQSVFPNANQNLAKNIERGITSTFPEGTDEMLDSYIDKLKNGDF